MSDLSSSDTWPYRSLWELIELSTSLINEALDILSVVICRDENVRRAGPAMEDIHIISARQKDLVLKIVI